VRKPAHYLSRLCGAIAWIGCTAIPAQTPILTYHNDIGRTGSNTNETLLTPANVDPAHFGKLFSHTVDGDLYAQPLYVPKLAIPGKGVHNVVFVATEADSLYAFDADNDFGANAQPLWQVSVIDAAHGGSPTATPVNAVTELACTAILPQVGITATPVIDLKQGTIYVEAISKENGAVVHRLHAIDISNGAERPKAPVTISGRIRRKGKGDFIFEPLHQLSRPALLLSDGVVHISYGSHCDRPPYRGWIFAYDSKTLSRRSVFITAAEHGKAGIWMGGAGPAADSNGNLFLATGDGWFDAETSPDRELGNSILKLALHSDRLAVTDYFSPFNQAQLARHDGDLGSGGVLLLPDEVANPRLLIQAGKMGTLYVLNRDRLTAGNRHYCHPCTSDVQIVQELPDAVFGGIWGMPAYWNGRLYTSGSRDLLRAFSLEDGRLKPTPSSVSQDHCGYPGCGLSISADGSKNGILWALEVGFQASEQTNVLKAYDARDLSRQLYASDRRKGRDDPGSGVNFSVPTVANGKVYVGGTRRLSVFGLLARP
jgi:hypothetical protein